MGETLTRNLKESNLLGGQREFEQALCVKAVDKFNDFSLEGWVVDPF